MNGGKNLRGAARALLGDEPLVLFSLDESPGSPCSNLLEPGSSSGDSPGEECFAREPGVVEARLMGGGSSWQRASICLSPIKHHEHHERESQCSEANPRYWRREHGQEGLTPPPMPMAEEGRHDSTACDGARRQGGATGAGTTRVSARSMPGDMSARGGQRDDKSLLAEARRPAHETVMLTHPASLPRTQFSRRSRIPPPESNGRSAPPGTPHLLSSLTQAYGGVLSVGGSKNEAGEEVRRSIYRNCSGAVCEEGLEGCAQQSRGARHGQEDESGVRATWWTGAPQNAFSEVRQQSEAGGGRVGEGRQARRRCFNPRTPGILSASTWKLKSPLPRLRALVFRTLGMLPSARRHSSLPPRGSFTTPRQPLPANACSHDYVATTTTSPPSRLSGGPSPCVRPSALPCGHGSLAQRVSEPPPYPPPSAPHFTTPQVPLQHAPAEETAVHVRSRPGLSVSAPSPAHCSSPAFCKGYCDCTLQQDCVVSWRGYRPGHCT